MGTRYHYQKVDGLPPSVDKRRKPSKLQQILRQARIDNDGKWVLAATYQHDEGAAAAGKRLKDREPDDDWEYATIRFEAEGDIHSRLYLRIRTPDNPDTIADSQT
jgi:hypothetical protein